VQELKQKEDLAQLEEILRSKGVKFLGDD
jgi:hypothetical protein